jgi:hypothetical protein
MDCCKSRWRVKSLQAELVDKFAVTNLFWEDAEVLSNGFTRLARINIRYGKFIPTCVWTIVVAEDG